MISYEVSLSTGTAFMDVVRVEALDEEHAIELAVVQGYGLWYNLDELGLDELHDIHSDDSEYIYLDLTYYDKGVGYLYITNARVKEIEED